jgi:hypothetical protein
MTKHIVASAGLAIGFYITDILWDRYIKFTPQSRLGSAIAFGLGAFAAYEMVRL